MIFALALTRAVLTFIMAALAMIFLQRSLSLDIFHRLRRHYSVDKSDSSRSVDLLVRAYKFVQRIAKPIADLNLVKRLDFKVKQAGIPLFGSEFIIISIIGAILFGIAIYIILLPCRLRRSVCCWAFGFGSRL